MDSGYGCGMWIWSGMRDCGRAAALGHPLRLLVEQQRKIIQRNLIGWLVA